MGDKNKLNKPKKSLKEKKLEHQQKHIKPEETQPAK